MLRAATPRIEIGPRGGKLALGALILAMFAVVLFATAQASVLVPRSYLSFPHWESGPLHHLFGALSNDVNALDWGFSTIVVLALVAYAIALAAARLLSMRTIVICVLSLHAIALLSPPLHLTDVFSYLGYARLGALHHLNPYTHVINDELHDPVYHLASWRNLRSPYGPLFTALTYPLAYVSLPVAYWILKAMTVLMSLGFIALVWQCARQLGRDPRLPVLFIAANPIFVFYALVGFHNDFFMLVPSIAAISFMLARHDRAAGAAVMLAVAVKFTAILLLPFLLLAALTRPRRLRMLEGAAAATVPLVAMSLALFGLHIPNLADQSTLLTDFSIPNVFGLLIGIGGGTPGLLRLVNVLLVLFVLYELRRNRDWLSGAGWSMFALIASLAWLVPWYVIWLLPLAGLGTSVRLRRVAAALTVYLVFAFVPETSIMLSEHGINPLGSAVGQASVSRQNKLGG
jgi:alpha-1,6-mannosyltransferase